MDHFPQYYTALFNAVTDAVLALERHDFGTAKALLLEGQKKAESLYMEEE